MPNLDPTQIRVAGTGALWKAPIGTPIPSDSTTAWNAGFVHLGYATNGFTVKQNLKTKQISGWQSLDVLRVINTDLDRSVSFESLESDRQNLSLAWGGGTIANTGTPVGGSVTVATAGAITTATAHGFSVGDSVVFAGTGATGLTAGTPYFVTTVGSSTTFVVSATKGGTPAATSAGSATSVASAAPYSLTFPDAAVTTEFILGIDWSDGAANQRLILQRAALLSLPTIKYVRDDAVRYPLEVQSLKPSDGTQSILIFGNDAAATS